MSDLTITVDTQKLKFISKTPDVLGGAAVIKGTRIPVSRIMYLMREGYTPEMIREYEYPQLDVNTISGTISEVTQILDKPINDKVPSLQTTP